MNTFLTIVHIIVCVFLILVVLLQAGKGGGMGIAFGGGGSQTVFGSSGAGNFLTRLTSITAVIFMITSLVLAHNSSAQDSKRLQRLEGKKAADQEAEKARLDKLKADIEKSGAAKSGQSAAPTAPASGAAGAPAATPDLPLKLTAPNLGKTGEEAAKAPGKSDNAKGAAKPAAGSKPAKDAAAKEGAAAPGEKPAKKRKKAPAEGETGATPAPAPAAAPPAGAVDGDGIAMALPFTKVEGLGNDFLVVDLRPGRPGAAASGPSPEDPAVVRALCDRRFGVGGDGVLAILPSKTADARMRVLNADGSEAEMCGNGIRCVAKLLHDTDPTLRRPTLRIETGAGVLAVKLDVEADRVRAVEVDMGRPRLTRDEIPILPEGTTRVLREPISARGRTFHLTAVSMGNPHAVIFVDDPASLHPLAEEFGPLFERAERFPRRANVEFAYVRPDGEIDLVVWERGSGITMACGTGACATVVAACLEERLAPGRETTVHLPGGPLSIAVAADYSTVHMRGPARSLFEASIDVARLMSPTSV